MREIRTEIDGGGKEKVWFGSPFLLFLPPKNKRNKNKMVLNKIAGKRERDRMIWYEQHFMWWTPAAFLRLTRGSWVVVGSTAKLIFNFLLRNLTHPQKKLNK